MSKHHAGRHRAQSTPANPVSAALGRAGAPAGRASAVLAVSGGIVASLSLPASAAGAPAQAPAITPSVTPDTVAVAAPATSAPVVSPAFGQVGFKSVAPPAAPKPVVKPAPKPAAAPKPVKAPTVQSSRSTVRPAVAVQVPSAVSSVLSIAAQYAGVPYVYGGTTPAGFDCSGFTQYVFGKLGIQLPRTAEAQRQATRRVSTPQPGDLVFFGSPAYHVGIYAGNGTMWAAPHSGSVVKKETIWTSAVTYGRP